MKVVRGALVVTMDGDRRVLRDAAVAVDGTLIADVGSWQDLAGRYPRAEHLGGAACLVIPGLVNAHNHMFQVLYRTLGADQSFRDWLQDVVWPMSTVLTEEDAYAAVLLASVEMLRTGTTTVVDSHYINTTPGMLDAVAAAVDHVGIRAVLGRASVDWTEWAPIRPEFLETPDAAARAGADLIERWHGKASGRIRIRPEPLSETSVTPDMVRALSTVARQYGTGMNMHAAEVRERVEFIQAKFGARGTVDYLDRLGVLGPDLLLAHCVWLAPEEIAVLRERGTAVVHNPVSNAFLGDGVAPIPDLTAAGVMVGLGTDGPCSNDSLDMFGVMKAGALIHKAVRRSSTVTGAEATLAMATINGARAAGIDGLIGSIEPGKRADLVVATLRQPEFVPLFDVYAALVYAANAACVDTVLVNGQVVVRGGHLTTVDEDEIARGAERLAWRLLRRAGVPRLLERAGRLGWPVFGGADTTAPVSGGEV
ncbi:MAG: amidohydrolase [Armatimonadota bacterium]|nr:amidohydrolase [Armatimonadota bacterium]